MTLFGKRKSYEEVCAAELPKVDGLISVSEEEQDEEEIPLEDEPKATKCPKLMNRRRAKCPKLMHRRRIKYLKRNLRCLKIREKRASSDMTEARGPMISFALA